MKEWKAPEKEAQKMTHDGAVSVNLVTGETVSYTHLVMMNGYEYTGMDAMLAGSFRAAIYCRLSKDDDLDGESASIANQRDMLESYCEKQGWEVVAVYQDDGYTGLNMELSLIHI